MSAELKGSSSDEENTDFIGFSPVKLKTEGSKEESVSQHDIDEANAMAKQLHVYKPGITFVPGAKLVVLDARDNKWYQCRVVEVDWGELDILVHYDRWSIRFDEWLKMDSTRIKPLEVKKKERPKYKVGEKVLGYWAPDSKYYLGQVMKNSSEDYYEVLFFDGIAKCLRSSQLKKITNFRPYMDIEFDMGPKYSKMQTSQSGSNLKSDPSKIPEATSSGEAKLRRQSNVSLDSPPCSPSLSAGNTSGNIFNVEILAEKRKTKRTPDVEELFKSRKRKRKFEDIDDEEEDSNNRDVLPSEPKIKKENSSSSNQEAPPKRPDSSLSSTSDGMPSKDISYFEVDMGKGWKKVCHRRSYGPSGKWNVYYIAPDKRRCRTRQEIWKCKQDFELPVKMDDMDFSVRTAKQRYDILNAKDKPDAMASEPNSSDGESKNDVSEDHDFIPGSSSDEESEEDSIRETDESKSAPNLSPSKPASSESEFDSSPIKQEVTSVKLSQILQLDESQKTPSQEESLHSLKIPIGPLVQGKFGGNRTPKIPKRAPDLEEPAAMKELSHKCPQKNCEKSFRKESLLQMHLKHYHPELLKRNRLPAPNVADLAYARTVGDHLDQSSASPVSGLAYSPSDFVAPDRKIETRRRKISEGKKSAEKKPIERAGMLTRKESIKALLEESESEDDHMGSRMTIKEELKYPRGSPNSKMAGRCVTRLESIRLRSRKSESLSDDFPIVEKKPASKKISRPKKKQDEVQAEVSDRGEEPLQESLTEAQSDQEDAIIHCGCRSQEEDGLMLQCDICLTWQHGGCYDIEDENQVPEKYICSMCENPPGLRSSMRFRHHQDWIKDGKLPRFSFSKSERDLKLESVVRRGHELSGSILQLSNLIHSLKVKLNIAKEPDHPKIFMWHKKWSDAMNETQQSSDSFPKASPSHAGFVTPFNTPNANDERIKDTEKSKAPLVYSDLNILQSTSVPNFSASDSLRILSENPILIEPDQLDSGMIHESMKVFGEQPSTSTDMFDKNYKPNFDEATDVANSGSDTQTQIEQKNTNTEQENVWNKDDSKTTDNKIDQSNILIETKPENTDDNVNQEGDKTNQDNMEGKVDQGNVESDIPKADVPPTSQNLVLSDANTEQEKIHSEIVSGTSSELDLSEMGSSVCEISDAAQNKKAASKSHEETIEEVQNKDFEERLEDESNKISGDVMQEEAKSNIFANQDRKGPELNQELASTSNINQKVDVDNNKEKLQSHSGDINLQENIDKKVNKITMEYNKDKPIPDNLEMETEYIPEKSAMNLETEQASECESKNSKTNSRQETESDKVEAESVVKVPEEITADPKAVADQIKDDQNKVLDIEKSSEMEVVEEESQLESNIDTMVEDTELTPQLYQKDLLSSLDQPDQTPDIFKTDPHSSTLAIPDDLAIGDEAGSQGSQEPLVDTEDFVDLELGALDQAAVPGMNEGFAELLSSHLGQLVDAAQSDLAPLVVNAEALNPAPIIPKNERIEPETCKLNLLHHVEELQDKVFSRFDEIEAELKVLEEEMGLNPDISPEEEELLSSKDALQRDSITLQSRVLVNLLLRDIETVNKLAEFSSETL